MNEPTHTDWATHLDQAAPRFREAGLTAEADTFARQAAMLKLAANGVTDPATLRAESRRVKRGQSH